MTKEERMIESLKAQIVTMQGTIAILEDDNYKKTQELAQLEKAHVELLQMYGELMQQVWG